MDIHQQFRYGILGRRRFAYGYLLSDDVTGNLNGPGKIGGTLILSEGYIIVFFVKLGCPSAWIR
jgi:hypothetical protein